MLDTLAHRAGGFAGVWTEGPVGLAQATPEPSELRPLRTAPQRLRHLVLVADARIDNGGELSAVLDVRRSVGDGALILAAYERWGRSCAERLIGDFAFAIWDARRRELFCARDVMGVKPFYFVNQGSRFAFASEAKALLALPGVSRALDEEQIALFLGWRHDDREKTMYRAIRRLPAAHVLMADRRGVATSRYWSIEDAPDVRFAREDQYVDAFRERFTAAVHARLRTTHPIAAALSGGLDSSSIVCEARRQLAARDGSAPALHAISIVFPDAPARDRHRIDEQAYAELVTREGGLCSHFVRGDRLSPLADLREVLRHVDEPYFAPNLYLHWAMYRAAHEAGARVFLDGLDGDTTVSHGFGRLNSLLRSEDWDGFEAEVRAYAQHRQIDPGSVLPHFGLPQLADLARSGRVRPWLRGAGELTRRFGLSRRDVAVRYGLAPLVPPTVVRAWRRRRWAAPQDDQVVLRRSVLRRLAQAERRDGPAAAVSDRAMHVEGLTQPVYQLVLEIADKCASAFGVEPRYPFFDRRLMELCVAVPEELKFRDGWGRLVFRRAMDGVLPREIQWRSTKADLSSNFRQRLREVSRPAAEGIAWSALAPYVDVDRLRAAFRRFTASEQTTSNGTACLLFRATVLAAWLEQSAPAGAVRQRGPGTPEAA
jgi:asparagine synthase (glutamine-hydrolysing)